MYCSQCGKPLQEGEQCTCQPLFPQPSWRDRAQTFIGDFLERTGLRIPVQAARDYCENGLKIVPDIIKANDGEVPVKQYDVAIMRSRIRGHYARGRLQVTNKRVIFRSAGISYSGPISQQYEIALEEVAGIEVKKKTRLSMLSLFICYLLNLCLQSISASVFSNITDKHEFWGIFTAALVAVGCVLAFFALHKRFWIKLALLSLGNGALLGAALATNSGVSTLLVGIDFNLAVLLFPILSVLCFINAVIVSMVPDLVLIIKTRGGSPAFEIRRKQFPTPFRQSAEYTDFSEVIPLDSVGCLIREIGALIDDLQTMGDMAIEKWKQN